MALRLTNYSRDGMAAAFKALFEGDYAPSVMKIYSGTLPSDVDDDDGTVTLLALMTFTNTAFNASTESSGAHGELSLFSALFDNNTNGTGTANWGLIEDVDGNKLLDFECPSDLNLGEIEAGGTITVGTFTMTMPDTC